MRYRVRYRDWSVTFWSHLRVEVLLDLDTAAQGGPLFRSTSSQDVWQPAARKAGLPGVTFHTLRHSFVAMIVAAGCNVREVSEWAGHNSVGFTLTRYGGLFDGAVNRLDDLLG